MVCARDVGRVFVGIGFLDAHWKAVPVCCGCPWGVVQCAFPSTSDEVLFSALKPKSFLCPVCTVEKDLNLAQYWCQWRAAPNDWGLWNTFSLIYSFTTTLDVTPKVEELDLSEWSHLVPSTEAAHFPFLWHWRLEFPVLPPACWGSRINLSRTGTSPSLFFLASFQEHQDCPRDARQTWNSCWWICEPAASSSESLCLN